MATHSSVLAWRIPGTEELEWGAISHFKDKEMEA